MAFIRPEVTARLKRWSGVLEGAAIAALGLWLIGWPGWVMDLIGGGLVLFGAGSMLLAWRRLRFSREASSPGLIEIDEGRLRFLHPSMGGDISLNDLLELQLLELRGRKVWRLKDMSGQAMLVPLDASGSNQLFDALSALPGLSSSMLLAALEARLPPAHDGNQNRLVPSANLRQTRVWRRPGSGVTRL